MSKALRVLLLSLVAGFSAYCVYLHFATKHLEKMAASPDAEMQWLRHEFHLTEAQFKEIMQLHVTYESTCELMCQRLTESNVHLQTMFRAAQGTVTPELTDAMKESSAVELECRQAMLEHIFAVSRVMSPESGERYRAMMETQLVQHGGSHTALAPAMK